jgi:DNA polymerase
MTILLDFETRSRADLKKIGGRNYWAHPSTEPLCCCWHDTRDGSEGTWMPGDPKPTFAGQTLAAHNMTNFDRFGCYKLGWLDPSDHWLDTSELCRVQGWPAKLESLGERYGTAKDLEASRFTVGLSTCRRPSGKKNPDAIDAALWSEFSDEEKREYGVQAELTPAVVERVTAYCRQDVEIMRVAWPDLGPWAELEPDVQRVDRIINDRGVPFDADLARALLECDARNADAVLADVARVIEATPEEVRRVVQAPLRFATETGAPNAQAETIDAMIRDGHPGECGYELARARQAIVSIAAGKLRAGLLHVSPDGLLRDSLWYYGGHTGRWSAKGMQLHNLTRPHKRYEDWTSPQLHDLAEAVKAGDPANQDEIDLLLRACLWAPDGYEFAVCDFSGVEARALAWVAGDEQALGVFREGKRDAYKVMASVVFNVPYDAVEKWQRQIGKNAELGCGYGMGHKKFTDYCAAAGTDLAALNVNPKDVIDAWRKLHAPIKEFWAAVEKAFLLAIDGRPSKVSCFTFEPSSDGRDVAIFLPSGRPVVYPNCRVRLKQTDWGTEKASIKYDEIKDGRIARGPHDGWLYGGKITENIIQALCRCLLADALVRVEASGLDPVLHVHDEIVCLVPGAYGAEALEYLHEIMTTLPGWAKGFPVGAAGFHGRRYRK